MRKAVSRPPTSGSESTVRAGSMRKSLPRRAVSILLVCAVLVLSGGAAFAAYDYENQTLEEILSDYMKSHGLTSKNFSMAYYNTVTGETYLFNEYAWMVAASTYKLPLNMYYYELQNRGELTPNSKLRTSSMPLSYLQRTSIVYSNNETSQAMINHLGYGTYKEIISKYSDQAYPASFYTSNIMNSKYMLDALTYLYGNAGSFTTLISHMKEAQPGQYLKKYVSEYEIAHKYGFYNSSVNDVGIVYTPAPYLIAIYTTGVGYAERTIGEINRIVCDYTLKNSTPKAPEPEVINASVTTSSVRLDGYVIEFDAYTINGNNYFKLRDVAYMLNHTAARFETEWDAATGSILLTKGKMYTPVGGEMSGKGTGDATPTPSASKIYLDGKEVQMSAYTIGGSNYFKLRDIAAAIGFGLTWDGPSNTILIDTTTGYTP